MMQLPFFFEENFPAAENFILSEESSKHIAQVLRMKENDQLLLTNGKGQVLNASIIVANKKKTEVKITAQTFKPEFFPKITIAISLIKNANRLEWFIEKATEIGVSEIIPFISERTEKQYFKYERIKNILVSAMLQSQQAWLPALHEPVKFNDLIKKSLHQNKYIAHCNDDEKRKLADEIHSQSSIHQDDKIILIGPEGDFTKDEIDSAIQNDFIPVSLGETRLRTETAGIVAAVLLLNK
jgi:16S rRNA (uracil1498-N3)-methyltransferase